MQFFLQGDPEYNSYERDIAVLNIFFAESTAFGDYLRIAKRNIHLHYRIREIKEDDLG